MTRAWSDIKLRYPIDKVVNQSVIDYLKNWMDLQNFRDKYLTIRLIYSNFAPRNLQLTTNYSIENDEISIR